MSTNIFVGVGVRKGGAIYFRSCELVLIQNVKTVTPLLQKHCTDSCHFYIFMQAGWQQNDVCSHEGHLHTIENSISNLVIEGSMTALLSEGRVVFC